MKYKITNLSTKVLNSIVQDNYCRFTCKSIRDYVDQKDDIDTLLYTRRIAIQEQELKEHDSELLRFERLQFLRSIKIPTFKYSAECLMLIYCELYKIGLTEGDL